ncbi:MAG: hypothetical protein J6P66_05880 [Bacteroidaceae bacterium]|nr:hypothetical protein [Bacteroidaceae bacterium]
MDTRQISERYTKIGEFLIDNVEELEALKSENIIYLSSTAEKKSKRRRVYGECEKVQEKNKWAIPCDFTITLFEPNLKEMSMEQIAVVIWHELLHVGSDDDTKYVRHHDLNDFKSIIERFGVNWSEKGKIINDEVAIMAAEEGKAV